MFGNQNVFKQILRYLKHFRDDNKDEGNEKFNKEVKTTIILFLTVTAAFVIMVPTFIIYAIVKVYPHVLKNSTFYKFVCLFFLHPIINPLLYAYNITNIRERGIGMLKNIIIFNTRKTTNTNSGAKNKISERKIKGKAEILTFTMETSV